MNTKEIFEMVKSLKEAKGPVEIARATSIDDLNLKHEYTFVFMTPSLEDHKIYACSNVLFNCSPEEAEGYKYNYEILETKGHPEDASVRIAFLEDFKDDSMSRLGKPVQKDGNSTTWVVDFAASNYPLPTGAIIIGIFPADMWDNLYDDFRMMEGRM